MTNRLHICQTCARDAPRAADGRTRGQHLTAALLAALETHPVRAQLTVRKVPCLSGCLSPCNVSLRAPGKTSVRLSRLAPEHVTAVLAFASLYVESTDGEVDPLRLPVALEGKMTARIPAPPRAPCESVEPG